MPAHLGVLMTFKHTILAAVAVMSLSATAAQAADYLPFGVQNDVLTSTVTGGGWSECFSQAYGTYGTSLSSALGGCGGGKLMLAARLTGSDTLLLLGQADRADVLFDTGSSNVTHNANGIEWYYSSSYSWGFANGGDTVNRTSCDASGVFDSNTSGSNQRLCWHTSSGNLDGGWRAGNLTELNGSQDVERVIFSFQGGGGAVPEPATWALMIGGFGLAGSALRRRRTASAAA